MIEQVDDRQLLGFKSDYSFYHNLGPMLVRATLGGGMRGDDADVALWKTDGRARSRPLVDSRVLERNFHMWGREEIFLNPQWRLMLGLRADYFTFNVADRLEGQPADLPHASGYAQSRVLSPKVMVAYSPSRSLDFFANAGTGFHSNDARNAIIDRRVAELQRSLAAEGRNRDEIAAELAARSFDSGHLDVGTLPRAVGAEIGCRTRLLSRLNLGAALWWLDLDSEFVYVGDAGTTEESGRSRRVGLDFEARLELLAWLWADTDINFSRGKARDAPASANAIPLAPRLTSTGGLTTRHGSGIEGALRYRHIGDRPANEDGSINAEGYTVLDLNAAYRTETYRVEFAVMNVLDSEWNEAQFDTESQLRGEAAPVSELHYTPGNPLGARVGLSYYF